MHLCSSCKSSQIKAEKEIPNVYFPSVPSMFDDKGNPLVKHDQINHEVIIPEALWLSILDYFDDTEIAISAIYGD